MQDALGVQKQENPFLYYRIFCHKKALLVQFGRTRVSKTRCRRFKSYRAWFRLGYFESQKKLNKTQSNCNLSLTSYKEEVNQKNY